MQRGRDFGALSPAGISFSDHSLHQGSMRNTVYNPGVVGDSKEKASCGHNRNDTHELTESMIALIRPWRVPARQIPVLARSRESGHIVPSPVTELLAADTC